MTGKVAGAVKWLPVAAAMAFALLMAATPDMTEAASKSEKTQKQRAEKSRQTVPSRTQVQSRAAPLKQAKTALVPFETAPFPYRGTMPNSDTPFLNISEGGRKAHSTGYGRTYWEDETYNDRRVLLHIPKGFDVRRPSIMIVFFHGHGATLERDVMARQRVPAQISESGVNAVLVAPQFAVNAADSSAGKFWEPGAFGRFIGEAGQQLSRLHGDKRSAKTFASMPVVIVAYSGGYAPAAWSVERGGLKKRVRGVILLDALYGELEKFTKWIEGDPSAFFVSAYLNSTREKNAHLEKILADHDVFFNTALDRRLGQGGVTIIEGGTDVSHRDLVTSAWTKNPISDLMKRLPEYKK